MSSQFIDNPFSQEVLEEHKSLLIDDRLATSFVQETYHSFEDLRLRLAKLEADFYQIKNPENFHILGT